MYHIKSMATPLANGKKTEKIFDILREMITKKMVKIGVNETTKEINKGIGCLLILAADTEPFEIIAHLPILCEEKAIPYIFVTSKSALGRACGISRSVSACLIKSETENNRCLTELINGICQ